MPERMTNISSIGNLLANNDLYDDKHIIIIIIRVFCPRAGPSLQIQEPRRRFTKDGYVR